MKIALLTPTFSAFSGIDRVVADQAEQHLAKGDTVLIMCLAGDMKSKAKVIRLGMPGQRTWGRLYRLFFFLDGAKIRRAAAMLKGYDVAVSHFYPLNLIAKEAKKKYGVSYVYHNHGVSWPRLFSSPFDKAYIWLFGLLSNASVKGCDAAVSVSKFLQDELLRETGIRSVVQYNRIDAKLYHPRVSGAQVRKKYGLGKDPVLLYVGRISPHKGVHLLIEAYKVAKQKKPRLKLLIVGKDTFPGYTKKLRAMADQGVIFTGFIPEEMLAKFYGSCDIYTTASLWEGFDLPAAEAQACGKPVVAFSIGSHPEVVKKGLLVKEGDVQGFADAILKTLKV
ncbi:MAG: glycosyltransferase family 4 protein [Nanoarchaeota archaeon]